MNKFDFDKINEAFRAGNRARKKESAQDAVESVYDIRAQIELFKKQTGKKLKIRDGHPYYNGDLWLRDCSRLTSLPDSLEVGECLDLRDCTGLTSLPAGLKVGENLYLNGCTGLTSLPDRLTVGHNLWLRDCSRLTSLPSGMKIGGGLDLSGCTGLTSLPFDLVVQGIYIEHHGILTPFFKKLGIPVDGNGDTRSQDWHEWQEAHGYLTEAFRAGNRARKKETVQDAVDSVDDIQAQIDLFKEQTGKELEIRDGHPYFDGYLRLKNCTRLPAGLEVEGLLELEGCTGLTSLPADLKAKGGLDLTGCTGLTSLPDGLKVGGSLYLTNCTGLTSLPDNLEVKETMFLPGCTWLTSLPAGLKVGGNLELQGCTGLTSLPFDLFVRCWIEHKGVLTPFFRKLGIPVDKKGNTKGSDWRKWQKAHGYLKEAFRTGNRARKKESAQDAVQSVDDIQEQIDKFREQTGIELEIRNGRPYFNKDLWIGGYTRLTSLPTGLEVRGHLNLAGCTGLTHLPNELKVGGNLWLSGCAGLTSLPAGLEVEGNLYLKDCTELTSLPFDLVVHGDWIEHWGILTPFFEKLGIQVEKDGDTRTQRWRNWQKSHGYLKEAFKAGNAARKKESAQNAVQSVAIHGWNPDEMESLWDDMTFKSGFSSEKIDAVNGEFSCHLELNPLDFDIELSITKYDGRMAELYADIRSSNQEWEYEAFTGSCNNMENLFRWADNWIRDTIEELNEHAAMYEAFKAGNKARKKESGQDAVESVDSIQTQIDRFREQTGIELEIRDGYPYFDEDLWLEDCTGLTSLPDGLKVGGALWLENCTGLTSLPDGLKVGKSLYLPGCTGLTSLPAGLKVGGSLNLRGCTGLTSLPFNTVIQGYWIGHNGKLTQFFRKLGIQVEEDGDTKAQYWRNWQKTHGYLTEAFKAGNRARKKESGQDAAAITDPMKSKVNFKDPFIAKAMEWGGIVTMEDCMEEDVNHFKEVINYAKKLAAESHSTIMYFPEFEFFGDVDHIPDDLFATGKGCGLEEITFHDKLSIGSRAFKGSYLQEVILSDAWCMEIHDSAFSNCAYLEKVALTPVIGCEGSIFANCTSLSEVSIDDSYDEPYDITFSMFSNCKALGRIELPEGLKIIKSQAFYGSGLKSVTLPRSLEHINNQAFGECMNLTTVRFLGDYCEIEDNAFRNCVNLRNIRANSQMFRYLYRYHRNLLERLGVPKGCRLLLD